MKTKIIQLLAISIAFLGASAHADTIAGSPVGGFGSTEQVGNVAADGTIEFYIPLNGQTVTYGVNGGTSYDTCSTYYGTCTGGSVEMFLYFDTDQHGTVDVSLDFLDLDVSGVNDPWFFIESLLVFDGMGNLIGEIVGAGDLTAGDANFQNIMLSLDVSGPFYLQLLLNSDFSESTPGGWYRNTAEYLLATVTVPEPETLALLGLGLLLVSFARRRAQRASR